MDAVCAECQLRIEEELAVHASGRYFHRNHFRCTLCGLLLQDLYYEERRGHFCCVMCKVRKSNLKCTACELPVDETYVKAREYPFHMDCFLCARCKQPFPGGEYHALNGECYDQNCYWLARLEYEQKKESARLKSRTTESSKMSMVDLKGAGRKGHHDCVRITKQEHRRPRAGLDRDAHDLLHWQ